MKYDYFSWYVYKIFKVVQIDALGEICSKIESESHEMHLFEIAFKFTLINSYHEN